MKKESARVVVTDGSRVAMSRDQDQHKIKMIGGKLEWGQSPREGAIMELTQETLGRVGRVKQEDLYPLPRQESDPGYIAHWYGLLVSRTLLDDLAGPGGDDVESIFLAGINEVEGLLHYHEWKVWWRELGKPAIEQMINER